MRPEARCRKLLACALVCIVLWLLGQKRPCRVESGAELWLPFRQRERDRLIMQEREPCNAERTRQHPVEVLLDDDNPCWVQSLSSVHAPGNVLLQHAPPLTAREPSVHWIRGEVDEVKAVATKSLEPLLLARVLQIGTGGPIHGTDDTSEEVVRAEIIGIEESSTARIPTVVGGGLRNQQESDARRFPLFPELRVPRLFIDHEHNRTGTVSLSFLCPTIVAITAYGGSRFGEEQDVTTDEKVPVPVWTLATEAVSVPDVLGDEAMTPVRLADMRTVLATLADSPIATLEAHRVFTKRDRSDGIPLHAASPLAQQLSHLVADTAKSAPATLNVAGSGEVLYRMVVPAKVAAQFGKGLVRPMASKAAAGGVYSMMRNSTGIAANATFVPVAGKAAVAGAATGSAATAGVAVVSAGALTVAAPLVLMAVAIGVSAYADHQRQKAIERITDLLEQLHEDNLENERNELDGCRDAIDKATSVLLDQGRIGLSLGLDSSSYAISTAIERTQRRLKKWQEALAALPDGPVQLGALTKSFSGINEQGGAFRAHLELARLAIALKRRVLVLQAVEHAQLAGTNNPFKRFIGTLHDDERRVDELESSINSVLFQLSTLELKRHGGFRSPVFTQVEVDVLLKAVYQIRSLGEDLNVQTHQADVAIEIERSSDGSLIVFPAVEA